MADLNPQLETLAFYPSRMKLIGLMLMATVLVATCYFCTRIGGTFETIIGYVGMVFFGLALFLLPRRLLAPSDEPRIVIGPDGVDEHVAGFGFIPWGEIAAVRLWQAHGTRMLCLHLHDPAPFLGRLSPLKRKAAQANLAVGASEVVLNFSGLTPDLQQAILHCNAMGIEVTT